MCEKAGEAKRFYQPKTDNHLPPSLRLGPNKHQEVKS